MPLIFWHGHGQSAKTWETTPDGREGFQTLFLRRGFPVYLLDQPRRGRAARSTKPLPTGATLSAVSTAAADEQLWFGILSRESSPIAGTEPKYERGKATLGTLTGQPQTGSPTGYSAFSTEIDVFPKEHLFADIFGCDVLSYVDRELTTIAALTSIGGVEPMLQSHLGICLHLGLTEPQLRQVFSLLKTNIGKAEAATGQAVLTRIMAEKR